MDIRTLKVQIQAPFNDRSRFVFHGHRNETKRQFLTTIQLNSFTVTTKNRMKYL